MGAFCGILGRDVAPQAELLWKGGVGHQHIGMNQAAGLAGVFLEPIKVKAVILIGDEAGLPIIAPLDYVQRDIGESYAGATRHGLVPR